MRRKTSSLSGKRVLSIDDVIGKKLNNLKLKIPVLLILIAFSFCSAAQNVAVRISLKTDKNEPVVNATVQVLSTADTSLLFVKTLKTDVFFSLKQNSAYFLRITAVDINEIFQTLQTGNSDTVLNVTAENKSKSLAGVTVISRKPLIKQEDDKTIIDAEVLAESSTNAFEVLEKTPGAILDQDGNVYLNSATPATIQINGREVKLSASDVASLLKSLPANSILKIEILRTPSAKYDAESSGGIVNIVLKKGVKLGTNGSIDISHFQGVYGTESAGFNVNRNAGKLNTYLSYNYTKRKNFEVYASDRFVTGSILFTQSSFTKFKSDNNFIGGGLDYEINKKWSVAYDAKITANKNRNGVTNNIDIKNVLNGNIFGDNLSLVNNSGTSFYSGNNFSAKYKIDSTGSEWINSLDYNYFKSDNGQLYNNIYILPARNTLNGDGNTQNIKNIISFKTDLVLKLKKTFTFETGAKLNFSISKNNAAYFSDSGTVKYPDLFQTNRFRYNENIAAAYLQVAKTIKGLTIKPGIRLEHTDITGRQLIPFDTNFTIKRTDLFPYVYLRHPLTKLFGFLLTGNVILRRSITRPYYEALNPYPKLIDQFTYEIGNPRLQPQFTNNYEFNVTADEFPVFSFGLNDIKNIFTNVTYPKGDTLFRTFDNLGTNKEVYMRAVGGIPPGGKYFFYAGTQLNILNYKGFYGGVPFSYKRNTWTFFMFQNYKPAPTLNLSIHGWMRVRGVFNFFELEPFGGLSASVNKTVLKKKMNIIFSGNDILRSNRNEFKINQPNLLASGVRYGDTRKFGIALKYNFGIKPKEEKKEGFEAPGEVN